MGWSLVCNTKTFLQLLFCLLLKWVYNKLKTVLTSLFYTTQRVLVCLVPAQVEASGWYSS